jgi:hypothetical protein
MKRKTLVLSVCLVLAALLALVPGGVMAQTKSPAIVQFQPDWQAVSSGAVVAVDVWAESVSDFYGVQFEFQFQTANLVGLTVTEGLAFTSVGPGNYLVTQNEFVGDRVRFAATLVGVAPQNGNLHLARIEFHGLAEGVSPLQWVDIILANDMGAAMPYMQQNGAIVVTDQLDITGHAFMQGRTNHTGIGVEASRPPFFTASTLTAADGSYAFANAPAGMYEFLLEHDLYLAAHITNCDTGVGTSFSPPPITLLGGDLNADQAINIMDLAYCGAVFGTATPDADINADGIVNLLDLVLIGINFGETGPTPYVCP